MKKKEEKLTSSSSSWCTAFCGHKTASFFLAIPNTATNIKTTRLIIGQITISITRIMIIIFSFVCSQNLFTQSTGAWSFEFVCVGLKLLRMQPGNNHLKSGFRIYIWIQAPSIICPHFRLKSKYKQTNKPEIEPKSDWWHQWIVCSRFANEFAMQFAIAKHTFSMTFRFNSLVFILILILILSQARPRTNLLCCVR